jgi:DNA-binding SARP family transcriptional activator
MEFRILGPLEVIEDGQALDLGGQKQRSLLAVLLLHANEVVSSDRLIEALWEDEPPETAAKALQVYVSQLRKQIGRKRLQTKAPGYALRIETDELDLARFHALRAEGRPGEALQIWRGPPLDEFAYRRFAQTEIAQLQDIYLACREERIDADLAAGRPADVVGELESLVAEHPLRERLRGQLMLALYRTGRQAGALEAYTDARRALVDEVGIEPSRELRELHQAILNQDSALELAGASTGDAEPSRGAFVGREAELAELVAGLDDAFAGGGRVFLLVGEPGIGKSRLAEELAGTARARGARVLVGRCWEAGGAPAYWPWVQSLRAYVRRADSPSLRAQLGPGAAHVAQLLPELHDLFPDVGEPTAVEPESARFRLFEATTSFLATASRTCPLVLLLDDLHAADEPSLLLLQFLARELGDSRLLVIGAYRDVDPTPRNPLTAALAELTREPVTRSLALSGLDIGDVRSFIELVSGETPSDALVAAIHEDTNGNPLFVGEIIRLLATEGGLDTGAARRPAIPQSVRDVIARRLGHLSEECNRALVLASVLGREFSPDALAAVAEIPQDRLLDTLDEAMEARVVADVPGLPGRLRFAHVLIRDTLYEGLTTARRVRLHRKVVETLEAGSRADVAELAHHSIAGSEFDKGALYARGAADHAVELLAYEEAARLYAMALEALELADPEDDATRCGLLLSLGDAQARAGNTPAAKETFLAAAAIARHLGFPTELARAAAGYAGRIVWARAGDDAVLVPLLEEALAALGDRDVVLRARLLARLGGALRDEPSRERRDALSAAAVELARRSGSAAALDYALEGRAYAILGPDTIHEQLALAAELERVVLREDRERVVAAYTLRDTAELLVGDVRGDEDTLDAALRIAEELRQPVQLWQILASKAMLAMGTGRLDDAEELMLRAFELGERAIPDGAIPHYHMQRYVLAELRGGLDEAEPGVRRLADGYPTRPVFRCALARLHAQLGRTAEARAALDELTADGVAALPFDQEWLFGMALLAETCVYLGDVETAAVLYELLVPWNELNAVDPAEGFMGAVSRYLGQLAALLDRGDEAARHFEEAIAMNERMGARPWLAYTQQDYARLLAGRDPERAAELLAEARATYRELGLLEPGEAPRAPAGR